MFRKVFFLLGMIFSAGAAEMVMDINFDGHPDKLVAVKEAAIGSSFDVMLYDPAKGVYYREPIFSTYIAGVAPLLDPQEKSIQTRLLMEDTFLPGYKFFVRNGKLCFSDGEAVPEMKFDWSFEKISPQMLEVDLKAGKPVFDEAVSQWEKLIPELEKRQIPYTAELFCRRFNNGYRADPGKIGQWEKSMQELFSVLPNDLPSGEFTPEINSLRETFLTGNAEKTALMEKQTADPRDLTVSPDPAKPFVDQSLWKFSLFRDASRIYAVKIRSAAVKKDWAAVMANFSAGEKLILPANGLLHFLVNNAIDVILMQALCDAVYQAHKQKELTPELISFARNAFAGKEKRMLKDFYSAYQMEAGCAFNTIDSLMHGYGLENDSVMRPDGMVLYYLAAIMMHDKVAIGKFYCNALDVLKKDPYLTGEYDYQPEKLYICGALVAMDIFVSPVYNALAFYRSADGFLDYLEYGRLPEYEDPYTGKKLRFYRGEFTVGRKQKKVRGIRIYSVGKNLKDENGSGDDPGVSLTDITL
ncbi:MAG: hypothetical protein IKD23_05380 [Lentisphaeria bacterium]|nr:hypothetical protein [Lentisphaeria bacterium]